MIEVNPTDDWGEEQIEQAVDDFSDWAAGEESPLSVSMAEHYFWIKSNELTEPVRQAILEYAQDFGVEEMNTITLDLASWTRLAEVDAYAHNRGIDRAEAIRELVNAGLSHQPIDWPLGYQGS